MTTRFATCILLSTSTITLLSCRHDAAQPQSSLLFPQVKAIIQTNCLACHVPGGEGMPVFLNTDENIVALAASIKHATVDPVSPQNRRMPPTGDLSDEDKLIITQWFEAGGTADN